VTSRDPLKVYRENLLFIGVRETAAQAVKEQALAQFGQLYRLGQTLCRRHSAKRLKVEEPVGLQFTLHVGELYPR